MTKSIIIVIFGMLCFSIAFTVFAQQGPAPSPCEIVRNQYGVTISELQTHIVMRDMKIQELEAEKRSLESKLKEKK